MSTPISVLVQRYDSPQGPAFDREGNLYFVNWLSSSIVKLTPEGDAAEYISILAGSPARRLAVLPSLRTGAMVGSTIDCSAIVQTAANDLGTRPGSRLLPAGQRH